MITLKTLRSEDGVVDIDLNPAGGEFTTTAELNTLRGRVSGKNPVSLGRAGRWPVFSGSTRAEREFTVTHAVAASALEANLQLLEGVVYSQRYGALLLTFEEEGIDKTAFVTPRDLEAHGDNRAGACADLGIYTGTWVLYDQHYHAADATDTEAVETAGDTTVVAVEVAGTVHTERVTITLTPTALKDTADGQQWRIPYTVVNTTPRPLVAHPVEVTDQLLGAALSTGLDHGGLVTGGDSLESGDDIEALSNKRQIPRWAFPTDRTWDEVDTGVVVNLTLPPRRRWTVAEAILGSDTEVRVRELRDLANLPAPLPFLVARVTVAAQDVALVTAVDPLTGVLTIERDQRGTTGAAWSAGDLLYWVPREGCVDLIGGWLGAPAPSQSDDEKPCILDADGSSSNSKWVWAEFYETGIAGDTQRRKARTASWFSRALAKYDREKKTGDGDQYWRYVPLDGGDPATTMGLVYNEDGPVAGRPLMDRWDWISGVAFDSFTFDLEVTVSHTADLEARVVVYVYDEDGNEIVAGRYDVGTHAAETIALTAPALGVSFRIEPYDPKTDGAANIIALEPADGLGFTVSSMVVEFITEQQVVSIRGGQEDVYQFGRPTAPASIQNADGDTLYLYGIVCPLDADLVIDVEGREVTVAGEPATHLVGGRFPSLPPRTDIYPTAGPTALTYNEPGATGVQIAVSHRDCWN